MSVSPQGPDRARRPVAFATRTLGRSAGLLFALITLITISCAGYVYLEVQREKTVATAQRDFDRIGADGLMRMIAMEKKVRSDVAQVREILVGLEGVGDRKRIADGVTSLETLRKPFANDMNDGEAAAMAYGGRDLLAVFSDIDRLFPEYRSAGETLAKAYAAEDDAAIQAGRASFGKLGDEVQAKLKETGPAIDATKQARSAQTSLANRRIDELRDATTTMALASCVITALACGIGIWAVRRWVVRPLRSLTTGFARLAAGDTEPFKIDTRRLDEIGDLGRTYNDFRRIVLESDAARRKAREQEQLIESERVRTETDKLATERQKTEAMRSMVDRVEKETNAAVSSLIDLMDHMTDIASDMSGAADRLGVATESVSSASAEALASMRSASSTTKELTGSIERVADQVQDGKATSDEAVSASRRASQSIEALSKVAAEIDEVTGLIANITRQTGLLALNAGVEAARAGSEGHGFAIIAREIRSLADQTADATNKIGGLIRQVQGSTLSAVDAVDSISRAIDRVSQSSESVTEAIRTQVGTTKVIAGNVDGTTHAVTNVTSQIQGVAGEVQGAQTMARNVETVCAEASKKVRTLQLNLVKIVRTSSDAVNRREHPRYEMNAAGSIEFGGNVEAVQISDISEGGAKLLGVIDPSARTFALHVPGMDGPLHSRVARYKDGVIHSKFDGSEDEKGRLRSLLQRVADSGAKRLAERA